MKRVRLSSHDHVNPWKISKTTGCRVREIPSRGAVVIGPAGGEPSPAR